MDYLKQLNAYRRKRLAAPISSNAIKVFLNKTIIK